MRKEICVMKKITATVLAIGMIISGILLIPKQAGATDVVEDRVVYESVTIKDYWNSTDSKRTAPIKPGYVFGGWYKDANGAEFYTKDELKAANLSEITAYAKFVPARVLSVKAQNQADTTADKESTYVRIMSSLDSKNYEKVGFDIWLANKTQLLKKDGSALETTKIWDGLLVGEEERTANSIYGGVSEYLSVWQLGNVAQANYSKIIYVRPYWITKDGTKVEGLAKYVHIEDEYLDLISVPVNISGGAVAVGTAVMNYGAADLTVYGCEAGRVLTGMRFWHDETNNQIHMIGNAAKANTNVTADGILANIRFVKPTADTTFTMNNLTFKDWAKQEVTVEGVNINYVSPTTEE